MLLEPSGKGRKRQKKGEKGRFWPISGTGGQTPLNSRIFTAPESDPLEGGGGVIVQNYCHCISWEKATTIKMRFSKMLFFLCFSPTIKFQDGSPVDPLFEPPADPPF